MKLMLEHEVEQLNAAGFYSHTQGETSSFMIFIFHFCSKVSMSSTSRKTGQNTQSGDKNCTACRSVPPHTCYLHSLLIEKSESC